MVSTCRRVWRTGANAFWSSLAPRRRTRRSCSALSTARARERSRLARPAARSQAPGKAAVADGALGFWRAIGEVWPKTREQRCWVHTLVDHRAQETGWPAGDLGKPDQRPGGHIWDPAASRAHRRLRQPGSQSQRSGRGSLRRHAGSDCGADCRHDSGRCDRRRHKTHDKRFGRLPLAHDNPRSRSIDRTRVCRCSRRSCAFHGC